MARVTRYRELPASPERTFQAIAEFHRTSDWDPGIVAARRLDDGPLGVGSRFAVRSRIGPLRVPLVYEITAYDPPHRVVLATRGPLHLGGDDVAFEPSPGGTRITWRARFTLRGPGRLLDPMLTIGFGRVADAALSGLQAYLSEPPTA